MTEEEKKKRRKISQNAWADRNRSYMREKNNAWNKANPEKMRAASAKWAKANREKVRAMKNAWNRAHPEKARARMAAWKKDNQDRYLKAQADYRKNNHGKIKTYQAIRRAKSQRATPSWANTFFIDEIYDLARLRTKILGYQWHVDHIVPLQHPKVCGLHVHNNLRVISGLENKRKGNRHWPDMA